MSPVVREATVTSEAFLEAVIDGATKRFRLPPEIVCRIGRGGHNTIDLADHQVSRDHAIVQCTGADEFCLTDLGSRNGTLLNHRSIHAPVLLQPGDHIAIGSYEFVFHGPCRPSQTRQPGETLLDFHEKLITVLVTDIRDFTGLSRRLPEARLSELMSAFFQRAGKILSDGGAWGQKYIGDAVMTFWLHEGGTPDLPVLLAVFTALDRIFEAAAQLQSEFNLDASVRIGAGVNTGLACVGNMGNEAASDYTALSASVNLSFRLESVTKEIGCDVALGHRTYDFLSRQVDVSEFLNPHTVQLKGYREPVQVYGAARASVRTLLERLRHKLTLDTTAAVSAEVCSARTNR